MSVGEDDNNGEQVEDKKGEEEEEDEDVLEEKVSVIFCVVCLSLPRGVVSLSAPRLIASWQAWIEEEGMQPIHLAAYKVRTSYLWMCVETLQDSAQGEIDQITKLVKDEGVNINTQADKGKTALHYAITNYEVNAGQTAEVTNHLELKLKLNSSRHSTKLQ